ATAFLLLLALVFTATTPVLAALTGTISGTVTDVVSKAPLPGVKVTAVAPTGRATVTTDAHGFFSLTGLQPDTYTISFELPGFAPSVATGVTINAEQDISLNQTISKEPRTIARVTARSAGSAYQPNQTTDTYTVTSQQITTVQGKDNNNNEITLLGSLPGAETDSSGFPSLRGGRENEIGFEFEGMNYTEPFSNQFANSLLLNGVGSLQLSPGAGDASQGNSGTGVINLIAKRGTYPAFGEVSTEVASQTYWHDFIAEYGFATPDGRFSNYFKYIGQRQAELYGDGNQNLAEIGEFDGNSFNSVNDFVDNMIFKFGRGNSKSLQLFYQGQAVAYSIGAGLSFNGDSFYRSGDPASLTRAAQIFNLTGTNFSPAQVGAFQSLYPGQTSQDEPLGMVPGVTDPLQALKIQYNDNPDASTYYNLRFYRLSTVNVYDSPTTIPAPGGTNAYQILQGGLRTGGAFDFTRQLNSKNLVSVGAQYNFDLPVYSAYDARTGFRDLFGISEIDPGGFLSSGQGAELFDFLPAGASCPATGGFGSCGYLSKYFPGGIPRVPADDAYEPYQRQEYSAYFKDDIQATNRLKLSFGVHLDGSTTNFGDLEQQYGIPNGTSAELHPLIPQPRVGASYQIGPNDAISASFGRSIQNPYFSSSVNAINPQFFSAFQGIPAYDNITGNESLGTKVLAGSGPVDFCGIHANAPCKDYAEQLFWENQNSAGLPVFTVQPEQFQNYDFSWAHRFPLGISAKVTPFYRKGENIIVSTNPIISQLSGIPITGPTSTTNDGVERTTGVEFLLTRDAAYGFSGSLSATYINEFSNVPPLASDEDVFPAISPASLALGKLYRVGFLSPFVAQLSTQYQTHGGLRINPVIQYTRGYPYNQGSNTAFFLPNGRAATIPNTNLTSPNGSNLAPCYVDPGNPGSYTHPNLVACRGTAESGDPGGILSNARFNTNLTFEYTPPRSKVLFGVQVLGLSNNLYGYPAENDCYQPVAYGVSGPASGTGVCSYSQYAYGNGYNGRTNIRGGSPYL
ncbi:MAG: TonB-dependent receptor, partial [Candidatus Eremiobacteraeota bacterium]|nr:TonB-dependent receptor [Candidatus Eremiobacteraeota bacterium]